ncbi:MAG: hypothetical protein NZ602_03675 [Thermoguttaceae bacterium]|nr:hypothetical protein [Thermoguttaceae bacterium]MDW8037828.1 hypothetical protein [Thermoguttaceae bacterium]
MVSGGVFRIDRLGEKILVLAGVLVLACMVGCGSEVPFQLAPVQGRVTYEDGSPIQIPQGGQVRVAFVPQDVAPVGQAHPTAAQGTLNPDGSFSELTTYRFGDGAIIGRHKVTVLAVDAMEKPLPVVPNQYWNVSTTPLEVTVEKGGRNYFELKIKKGP